MKRSSPGLIFIFGVLLVGWRQCVVEGAYSVMGFRSYTPSHLRTVLELYKTYDRSFHYIHATRRESDIQPSHTDVAAPVWLFKKDAEAIADDEKIMERPDEEMNVTMENELFHSRQRATKADSLVEPTTILTVQYLSLVYAIQFGRGFIYFGNENDFEKSMACLKLAYYLAWFGLESDHIIEKLERILRIKYSTDANTIAAYQATIENLSQTRNNLKRVQSQFQRPKETVFDSETFFDQDFRKSVKLVGLYFREAVLGKTIVSYEQAFDWDKMHVELWSKAAELIQQLREPHAAMYLNPDSGRKNVFKSNVVSILRSIELLNVEKNLGNDFAEQIQKGLVRKVLTVKPTGSEGKLKFIEESLSAHFVTTSSEPEETKETSTQLEEGFTLLGKRNFGNEDMRILMEIMKICTKSEDYAVKSLVWKQEKYSSYWKTYYERSEFERSDLPQIGAASKNVYWQSYVAAYPTDLYSILFIQYLASVYSIRFAHGFKYFEKENETDKAAQCAKVAYFLARHGIDSELTFLATEKLLREKYPEELIRIWDVKKPMHRISSLIHENVIRKYNSLRGKIDFESLHFESEVESMRRALMKDIRTVNLYFRDLIFVKSSESNENIVDIKGSKILWNRIDVFDDMIDMIHTQSYVNLYPGIADMFADTAVSIVQFAEILSTSGKFQNNIPDLVAGLKNENFLVKRDFDRNLRFVKIENYARGKETSTD